MTKRSPIRYIVHNPFEEIPASYAVAFWGDLTAERFARTNARPRGGKVEVEYSDDKFMTLEDYSSKEWAK